MRGPYSGYTMRLRGTYQTGFPRTRHAAPNVWFTTQDTFAFTDAFVLLADAWLPYAGFSLACRAYAYGPGYAHHTYWPVLTPRFTGGFLDSVHDS